MCRFFTRDFSRPSLSTTTVSLLAALYIVLSDNRFSWHLFIAELGLETFKNWIFLFSMGLAFVLLLNISLFLFTFPSAFKPPLILLLLTASAIGYFPDLAHAAKPLRAVGSDAFRADCGPASVLVLVVGETARAREFAFNGYERDTNPQLANRGVIDFPDVQACGTSTSESLPCIFSSLGQNNFNRDRASHQENLLDILQRLGVTVLWRDNNSGSKGVADRVGYEELSRQTDAGLCIRGNCFDEILLRDLDRRLVEATGDMLIVLHMKGSHGPSYYKRTPPAFKVFSPECSMDNIQDCSRESIVNAYDNSILYTDHVLSRVIDLLKAQNYATAMLYVSDHGESLGENGLYLHGLPYALAPGEQTQVPMIFWASDAFIKQKSLDVASLEARRQTPYSHDFIFHSVLGLFGVGSEVYRPELDIFAGAGGLSSQGQRQNSSPVLPFNGI